MHLHEEIAPRYDSIKKARAADGRLFEYRFAVTEKAGVGHMFIFDIDDTTSAEHLVLAQIKHRMV